MKFFLLLFVPLLAALETVNSFKVLLVGPLPSHSHYQITFKIGEALANRGHEVTYINPHPRKTPIKNLHDIPIVEIIDYVDEFRKNPINKNRNGLIENQKALFKLSTEITEKTFSHKNVQNLLNSNEKFDVVIIEYFMNEAFVGFAHRFKAPVILISPMASVISDYMLANPAPSSYVPTILGSDLHNPMNFLERTQNFFYSVFTDVMREMIFLPGQRALFKKYFKTEVELDDIIYNNVSLILANSHVSVQEALPKVPNVIEIGGYHVAPPKELPKELKDFLDEATEGVVLFSMGSNLKSKDLLPEVRSGVLKALGKIKQKVLWKFETDLPEAPPNVKVMSWLPQQDVLAHPNVKAFITHGGLLSTIETVYFGVPAIAIPVFGDQKSNAASAVNKGYAVSIPITELSEEKLSLALDQILNNPKYSENAQMRSRVMQDRPLSPIDTAMYWIEYVVRHKGAPHLRSAATNLNWYQRYMVDIIAILTLATLAVFTVCYLIIKKIFKCVCNKKATVTKTKKNK